MSAFTLGDVYFRVMADVNAARESAAQVQRIYEDVKAKVAQPVQVPVNFAGGAGGGGGFTSGGGGGGGRGGAPFGPSSATGPVGFDIGTPFTQGPIGEGGFGGFRRGAAAYGGSGLYGGFNAPGGGFAVGGSGPSGPFFSGGDKAPSIFDTMASQQSALADQRQAFRELSSANVEFYNLFGNRDRLEKNRREGILEDQRQAFRDLSGAASEFSGMSANRDRISSEIGEDNHRADVLQSQEGVRRRLEKRAALGARQMAFNKGLGEERESAASLQEGIDQEAESSYRADRMRRLQKGDSDREEIARRDQQKLGNNRFGMYVLAHMGVSAIGAGLSISVSEMQARDAAARGQGIAGAEYTSEITRINNFRGVLGAIPWAGQLGTGFHDLIQYGASQDTQADTDASLQAGQDVFTTRSRLNQQRLGLEVSSIAARQASSFDPLAGRKRGLEIQMNQDLATNSEYFTAARTAARAEYNQSKLEYEKEGKDTTNLTAAFEGSVKDLTTSQNHNTSVIMANTEAQKKAVDLQVAARRESEMGQVSGLTLINAGDPYGAMRAQRLGERNAALLTARTDDPADYAREVSRQNNLDTLLEKQIRKERFENVKDIYSLNLRGMVGAQEAAGLTHEAQRTQAQGQYNIADAEYTLGLQNNVGYDERRRLGAAWDYAGQNVTNTNKRIRRENAQNVTSLVDRGRLARMGLVEELMRGDHDFSAAATLQNTEAAQQLLSSGLFNYKEHQSGDEGDIRKGIYSNTRVQLLTMEKHAENLSHMGYTQVMDPYEAKAASVRYYGSHVDQTGNQADVAAAVRELIKQLDTLTKDGTRILMFNDNGSP